MPPNQFAHLERETILMISLHFTKFSFTKLLRVFIWFFFNKNKYKPTNVGRIALERQARQFNSWFLV